MSWVFDIGMFDGEDSRYYLDLGFQVVAVEANPDLVASAQRRFAAELATGQLVCIHGAITPDGQPAELILCGDDLGASSLFGERLAHRSPVGTIDAPGITLDQLFAQFGVPEYLKIDIEGADRLCVLALTGGRIPPFLSFELGDDGAELIAHAMAVGYRQFKLINQNSFRELANEAGLWPRLMRRWARTLAQTVVHRHGRLFVAGHSSGPVPWHSDGQWQSGEQILERLAAARANGQLYGWYDIHACC